MKRLLRCFIWSVPLIGCSYTSDEVLQAHFKARTELTAILAGEALPQKTVHISMGSQSLSVPPKTCDGPALLPVYIYPSKSRYTYLVVCDKTPLFAMRIERSDHSGDISLIVMPASYVCDAIPAKCLPAALQEPDKIDASEAEKSLWW